MCTDSNEKKFSKENGESNFNKNFSNGTENFTIVGKIKSDLIIDVYADGNT